MGKIIKWEIPELVDNILKHEILVWDKLPPEPVKHNIVKSVVESIDLDFTSPSTLNNSIGDIESAFIRAVDENNYYWMSQTEVTDFLYRAGAYSVDLADRAVQFGANFLMGLN